MNVLKPNAAKHSLCKQLAQGRREYPLHWQASGAFVEYLKAKPYVVGVSDKKYQDTARLFISTYPGMMSILEKSDFFDVGYFDLIIADESHRSIYNVFGNIFKYFDLKHN